MNRLSVWEKIARKGEGKAFPSPHPARLKACSQATSREVVRLQVIKIVTRHNQLQTIANQAVISIIKSNKTFKDILQKETVVNFLKANEFKAILPPLKKV